MNETTPTQAILDYVNQKISKSQMQRSLLNHRGYWVAAHATPDGGAYPAAIEWEEQTALFIFSNQEEFNKGNQLPVIAGTTAAINDVDGAPLFANAPDHFTRVELDAASPIALKIKATELGEIKQLARSVLVERALASPENGANVIQSLKSFNEYRIPFMGNGNNWVPMQLNNSQGQPQAIVFTAADCADAFSATKPPDMDVELMWMTLSSQDCFQMLRDYGFVGVIFNVSGPVAAAAFDIGICELILA